MKNVYNLNLLNQIDNSQLFDPKLLGFILNNLDTKELLNEKYHIPFDSSLTISGNFSAFLFSKNYYKSDTVTLIINELHNKININSSSVFNVTFLKNNYEISENCFKCLKNFHQYFNKPEIFQPLSDNEEKLIIQLLLKEKDTNYIYTSLLDDNGKKNFYNLLSNQTNYLHSINANDKNIFLENKSLKKVLALYSLEEQKNIIKTDINVDEIVSKYYTKLFGLKNFDLSSHLTNSPSTEVISAFQKHSKSDDFFVWVAKLLKHGANTDPGRLNICLKNPFSPLDQNSYSNSKTKNYSTAIKEIVDLAKYIKDDYNFTPDDIFKLFVLVVKSKRQSLYISIREKFELPTHNLLYINTLNNWTINNIPISVLEKEVLKNALDKELPINSPIQNKAKMKI